MVPLVEVATDNMDATSDADGVWHLCYRAGGALHHLKKGATSVSLGALGTGNCTVSAVKGGGAGIAWRSASDTDRLEYLWVRP